jgi:hypothetical protein
VSERQFLFPALLKGTSLTVVHPTDEQKSTKRSFNDTDVIDECMIGFGFYYMLTVAEIRDFVSDGKLTIKAEIQLTPATEREFSFN